MVFLVVVVGIAVLTLEGIRHSGNCKSSCETSSYLVVDNPFGFHDQSIAVNNLASEDEAARKHAVRQESKEAKDLINLGFGDVKDNQLGKTTIEVATLVESHGVDHGKWFCLPNLLFLLLLLLLLLVHSSRIILPHDGSF